MADCKPAETPADVGTKLVKGENEDKSINQDKYQSAIGCLLYLSTRTRPDIAFSVAKTARFCSQPTALHWTAVKRIMRYLQGTLHLGLLYKCCKEMELMGFSDLDDTKSTSGYVFFIIGAISWRSKKQSCVALQLLKQNTCRWLVLHKKHCG